VPQNVHDRLSHAFLLEERGDVDIKGKGVMHTWYLVGRRDDDAALAELSGFETLGQSP
jgi:adenylate cyclase